LGPGEQWQLALLLFGELPERRAKRIKKGDLFGMNGWRTSFFWGIHTYLYLYLISDMYICICI
jgi:hypothetical protein